MESQAQLALVALTCRSRGAPLPQVARIGLRRLVLFCLATGLLNPVLTATPPEQIPTRPELLAQFRHHLLQEEYSEATITLLKAQELYPGHPEVVASMKRLQQVASLRTSLETPIRFEYSDDYRQLMERADSLRLYFAPSESEVLLSFLATAALFIGADAVADWVQRQEDSIRSQEAPVISKSKDTHAATAQARSVNTSPTITLSIQVYCRGYYYANRSLEVLHLDSLSWSHLANVATDDKGHFELQTTFRSGLEHWFRVVGECGQDAVGTSAQKAALTVKLRQD